MSSLALIPLASGEQRFLDSWTKTCLEGHRRERAYIAALRARSIKAALEPLAAAHAAREVERHKLTAEHGKAETAFQNASYTVQQREHALKQAQNEQALARGALLRVEQQITALGDDNAYIHAQRTLDDAQRAYQVFTAI